MIILNSSHVSPVDQALGSAVWRVSEVSLLAGADGVSPDVVAGGVGPARVARRLARVHHHRLHRGRRLWKTGPAFTVYEVDRST